MKKGSSRPVLLGIIAVTILLSFATLSHVNFGSHRGVAPWAYRGNRVIQEQESLRPANDHYDDEEDETSTLAKSGPSALDETNDSGESQFHGGDHGKWAFATFMGTKEDDSRDDPYFVAARTLAYQLLQHPKSKTLRHIPLIVLVPPNVKKRKIDILIDEGARVIQVEPIQLQDDWMDSSGLRASYQFAKTRLWQLKEFDRILFIDAATLITRNIDDIFDESFVEGDMHALSSTESNSDFAGLEKPPKNYFMAATGDTGDSDHAFPPASADKMMDGVFMLKPDIRTFWYYESLIKGAKFDTGKLMNGLLNHAHRREGPMPWKSFQPGKWAVNHPGKQDLENKVPMLHTRFWDDSNRSWLDRRLIELWWRIQGLVGHSRPRLRLLTGSTVNAKVSGFVEDMVLLPSPLADSFSLYIQ